jgi:hypothetical protein
MITLDVATASWRSNARSWAARFASQAALRSSKLNSGFGEGWAGTA